MLLDVTYLTATLQVLWRGGFLLFLQVSLHLLSCFRAAMAFNDDYEVGMEAELIHDQLEHAGMDEGFVLGST